MTRARGFLGTSGAKWSTAIREIPRALETGNLDLRPECQAVKITHDDSGKVERFAHAHRSTAEIYEHMPMAVPSPDGAKVLWASDWEDASAPAYTYVARCPR